MLFLVLKLFKITLKQNKIFYNNQNKHSEFEYVKQILLRILLLSNRLFIINELHKLNICKWSLLIK